MVCRCVLLRLLAFLASAVHDGTDRDVVVGSFGLDALARQRLEDVGCPTWGLFAGTDQVGVAGSLKLDTLAQHRLEDVKCPTWSLLAGIGLVVVSDSLRFGALAQHRLEDVDYTTGVDQADKGGEQYERSHVC